MFLIWKSKVSYNINNFHQCDSEIKFHVLTWFLNVDEQLFSQLLIESMKRTIQVAIMFFFGSRARFWEYQQLSSMWLWDKIFMWSTKVTWFLKTSNFLNNFLSSQWNWTIQVAIMFLIWKSKVLRISATFINVVSDKISRGLDVIPQYESNSLNNFLSESMKLKTWFKLQSCF